MTVENFNYRTDPLFLRNEYNSNETWAMPIVPKTNIALKNDLRLIGFDKVKNGKDNHYQRIVHFFLYDYKFESIWKNPEKFVESLKKYKAVLTPDFSMYIEMNPVMQLYNTFRNRWVGAYLSKNGIKVIPTVNWGLENTFDFCFNGIEKGSTVAVSTYMVSEHNSHSDQKDFFMKGYNEMLRRIEPELVICYHKPFPEMKGNILYIDYDLSSWTHYEDDEISEQKNAKYNESEKGINVFKYKCGYVTSIIEKGTGSAFGGKWKPKKDAHKRLVGKPGSKNIYITPNGEKFETKIGSDGYATWERHHTTHNKEHTNHTNPHDHTINWDKNYPDFSEPINYPDGNVPEFKNYERINNMHINGNAEDLKFDSINDFKTALLYGKEIKFEWNNIIFDIFKEHDDIILYVSDSNSSPLHFNNINNLLDFAIAEKPLRKFITDVNVLSRNV